MNSPFPHASYLVRWLVFVCVCVVRVCVCVDICVIMCDPFGRNGLEIHNWFSARWMAMAICLNDAYHTVVLPHLVCCCFCIDSAWQVASTKGLWNLVAQLAERCWMVLLLFSQRQMLEASSTLFWIVKCISASSFGHTTCATSASPFLDMDKLSSLLSNKWPWARIHMAELQPRHGTRHCVATRLETGAAICMSWTLHRFVSARFFCW